jgi:RNA polymerase sigma factor (sigma-70 family)
MGSTAAVPMLSLDRGLTHYLAEIRKFPLLQADQESAYAKRWREQGDREAAYHLVTSHLRLVAKIAMRYRGYGLPVADVISEGNAGLMQAVKRFEPERGSRLASYAMWWIKASIQEYILRSWSLVKMEHEEANQRRAALGTALNILTPRERCIFEARYLSEPAAKLEDLSKRYGVSRERVRQIEIRSFEKVPAAVRGQCKAQPPAASKEFEMH